MQKPNNFPCLPALALLLLAVSCTTLRVDRVASPKAAFPTAVTLAPPESSGLFGYEDWTKNWSPLAESLALKNGFPVVPAGSEGASELRLYLSDKTFVRGYQSLHALYATLELRDAAGAMVCRVHYSEESPDTLESSHKLLRVMEICFEQLAQGLPKPPKSGG